MELRVVWSHDCAIVADQLFTAGAEVSQRLLVKEAHSLPVDLVEALGRSLAKSSSALIWCREVKLLHFACNLVLHLGSNFVQHGLPTHRCRLSSQCCSTSSLWYHTLGLSFINDRILLALQPALRTFQILILLLLLAWR